MAISNRVELAAEIVAAFVSYNPVPKGDLPSLIEAVHSAVERLEKGPATAPPQIEAKGPAVPIRKSITPDFLISLEDGKPYKLLRCSATIWMRKQRQSGWPFWRSRRGDDCRGATITQALFCREMI
jgi:predicted transcriptional regulator